MSRSSTAERERGFTLVEVLVCVGLLALASVAALALLPGIVRASQAGVVRDAATEVARAALDRAIAVAAYAPAAGTTSHAYAFAPSASYTAVTRLRHASCGGASAVAIALPVTLAYDASRDAVTVTVAFPDEPCGGAPTERVVLDAPLPVSALAPGTTITTPIGDPTEQ